MTEQNKETEFLSVAKIDVAILTVIVIWVILAAILVDIEYYDGFDTISNSRLFLGKSWFFNPNRAPLMGLLLVPAEVVKEIWNLHPLEVRPHHLMMALLHIAYLIGVYYCLV